MKFTSLFSQKYSALFHARLIINILFKFRNTAELQLSGLIGTARQADMQKILIIVFI